MAFSSIKMLQRKFADLNERMKRLAKLRLTNIQRRKKHFKQGDSVENEDTIKPLAGESVGASFELSKSKILRIVKKSNSSGDILRAI